MTSDLEFLLRGARDVVSREEFQKKLAGKKSLRVKFGVDPTAPDLHLGHTVPLNALRRFQDAGHTAVLIIGDFTAAIGDPSGRSETRPALPPEAVEKNAQTYLSQVFGVLDEKKTEVRRNSEWLTPIFRDSFNPAADPRRTLLSLLMGNTVQQLIEREDFSKRLKDGSPLSLFELLYPIMQGYDSVAVESDVELGGTDQLFNLLMGRKLQQDFKHPPQVVVTLPLLEGTDGVRKMSKTYGNFIALNDAPDEMFGKIMSVPDDLMWKYFQLLTSEDTAPLKSGHPMEAKKRLAGLLTEKYHGAGRAAEARARFEKVFSRREDPDQAPEHRVSRSPLRMSDLLVEAGLAPSKNEARRLLGQGAVSIAGETVSDDRELAVHSPVLVKVGKRQFRKILPA